MRNSKFLGLSAATALAAVVTGVSAAPAAASQNTRELVFRLISKQTQLSYVDVGNPGPSQGDEFVSSSDLYRGSTKVGDQGGVCTLTRTAPNDEFDEQCVNSLALPGGQLTAQGRLTATNAGPGNIDLAITGGTRLYRKARGYIHVELLNETDAELTVHLIL
ncbi:allene oxide cyclase barrel-like domain-containing protein [Streptomyces sp. bgisy100]|uniref:allene oxide cyclase barrel-like domain-containing protein n=1 Tax=Streptomyces sp. bgisy100 TaxID=3413783 RepID=UPI003D763648